jgi:HEPN pEK499 p136
MNPVIYVARNDALGFAERTKVNLEFIDEARAEGGEVHVVTQLANSLLGLIVFVWEKRLVEHMKELRLEDLEQKGWPKIEVTEGWSETLYKFVRHLRNAVAHGLVTFSSDSPEPREVIIQIDDAKSAGKPPYWSARMKASELRQFCLKFIALVKGTIS